MPVKVLYRKIEYFLEWKESLTLRRALEQVNLPPETCLVVREGEMMTLDDILEDDDVIQVIPNFTGG